MPRLRLLPPVTTIYSQEKAVEVLQYLMNRGGELSIDSETTGLDVMRDRILCWSMATENQRYFIPKDYLLTFDPLFNRKDITWFLANAKYDLHMFANMGMHFAGDVEDIVVQDAMDDDTRSHGLKEQARMAYDVKWGDFKDLFLDPTYVSQALGLEKNALAQFRKLTIGDRLMFVFNEKPEIVENYASCDAFFTYMRAIDLREQLAATALPTDMVPGFSTLLDYFNVIEKPFTKVLWDMERCGAPVDTEYAAKIDGPMRDGLRGYEYEIKKIAGPLFNARSAPELRDILFTKQGFNFTPVSYTTKGKTPLAGTAEKDLEILKGRCKDQKAYDFIELILKFKHIDKLHGTFVKKLDQLLGPDGRIHCKFNQVGTKTSRLSSSAPNLQNIPIRNDEYHIRGIFVAPDGMDMMDFDYPQIQPRIAAVIAGEEEMMEAIRNGWDIHSANAFNMYKQRDPRITYEAVTAAKAVKESKARALDDFEKMLLKCRDGAKTVGLGALFGEGPGKMAHQLRISKDDAKELIYTFFSTYPKIKALISGMHDFAHEHEMTHTMLGRIRQLYKINNPYNTGLVASEERQAFNTLIQGTEAEMMKLAMLRIAHNADFQALGGQIAIAVHDELIIFSPKENTEDLKYIVREMMREPLKWGPINIDFPVPIDPDGNAGERWSLIH